MAGTDVFDIDANNHTCCWEVAQVQTPSQSRPTRVVTSKNRPFQGRRSNRLQTFNIYYPYNDASRKLLGSHQSSLPIPQQSHVLVYIHGGAWRDPAVDSIAVEATVASIFADDEPHGETSRIGAVLSINYSLSPHPHHPLDPYEPCRGETSDEAREARHPQHILDITRALSYLAELAILYDNRYILAGHSAGATLACQAALVGKDYWEGHTGQELIPIPAAILGLNGLYNLPLLVHEPSTHQHLKEVYRAIVKNAFGNDQDVWKRASPASFDSTRLAWRAIEGRLSKLVMLAQSTQDQLVPMNQTLSMENMLKKIQDTELGEGRSFKIQRSDKLTGLHDDCWKEGMPIWHLVKDILDLMSNSRSS